MAKHLPVPVSGTIANGESLSGALDVRYRFVVGLITPAEWDAAGIGFHVSYDGGTTFVQLSVPDRTSAPPYGLDELEILAADVPPTESVYIALDPAWFLGVTHVKVRSQTAGSAVVQTPARTVILMTRDVETS